MTTKLKVIMFTDRVGASRTHDENARRQIAELLERFTRDTAMDNQGAMVKFLGDGHLLTFDSAFTAIRAGLDLQKRVKRHNVNSENSLQFQVRVGIDVGDVEVGADGDVLGHFVDMAKRVEDAGRGVPSPVLFTERVKSLLQTGLVTFRKAKKTPVRLKGSREAVFLYQASNYNLHNREPRRKLSAYLTEGFIQVLLPEFGLAKSNGGLELQVEIERRLEIITTSRGKDDLFSEMFERTAIRDGLIESYASFTADERRRAKAFSCGRWPLRYANGGALPIIRLGEVDYACLFYRDVQPVGWNIANGASDSYVELYDPERIIHREFGEEFIIANHDKKALLFFDPGIENIGPGYRTAIVAALDRQFPAFRFGKDYSPEALRVNWEKGPDSVRVTAENDEKKTSDYFLSITPHDNAIEVDRVARIDPRRNGLPSDPRTFVKKCAVLDGELGHGRSVGRIVGLFRLDHLTNQLNGEDFRPDHFFYECEGGENDNFEQTVKKAVRSIQRIRRAPQKEHYAQLERKFDLCPITRSLLDKYSKWRPVT